MGGVRTTPWQAADAVTLPSGVKGRVTGNQQVQHSGLRLAVGQAKSVFAGGQGDFFRNAAPTPVGVETGVPELIVVVVDADKEGITALVRGLYTVPRYNSRRVRRRRTRTRRSHSLAVLPATTCPSWP